MEEHTLLNRTYDGNSLPDIGRDVTEAIEESPAPQDEHGFAQGVFEVTVKWRPE